MHKEFVYKIETDVVDRRFNRTDVKYEKFLRKKEIKKGKEKEIAVEKTAEELVAEATNKIKKDGSHEVDANKVVKGLVKLMRANDSDPHLTCLCCKALGDLAQNATRKREVYKTGAFSDIHDRHGSMDTEACLALGVKGGIRALLHTVENPNFRKKRIVVLRALWALEHTVKNKANRVIYNKEGGKRYVDGCQKFWPHDKDITQACHALKEKGSGICVLL